MEKEIKPTKLKKKEDGWWIIDPNNTDVPENGPYDTKAEADNIRKGLERFWRYYA